MSSLVRVLGFGGLWISLSSESSIIGVTKVDAPGFNILTLRAQSWKALKEIILPSQDIYDLMLQGPPQEISDDEAMAEGQGEQEPPQSNKSGGVILSSQAGQSV